MKLFWFIFVLASNPCLSFSDVYIYRVSVDKKSVVKAVAVAAGIKERGQPFYGTYELAPADTNYVLIKVSLPDGSDPKYEASGVDLWQVQKLGDDGFVEVLIDNSKLVPVDKNWKVKASTP